MIIEFILCEVSRFHLIYLLMENVGLRGHQALCLSVIVCVSSNFFETVNRVSRNLRQYRNF
jgi:hypothetical protein